MPGEDVTQIKAGKNVVGIRGLKTALDGLAEKLKGKPDEEIQKILIGELMKKNYIPERVRDEYGKAFLREYKKYVGEVVARDEDDTDIKIVGPGCAQCDKLEQIVLEVLSELRAPLSVEHIRDPMKIGEMGIMGTPALVVGKNVVIVGSVPSKSKVKEHIEKYVRQKKKAD